MVVLIFLSVIGCFALVAKKRIKANAQIFLDYGPEYWGIFFYYNFFLNFF